MRKATMPRERYRWDAWSVFTAISIGFFALFLIYPLILILSKSFLTPEGGTTAENFRRFFAKPYYFSALFNSFKVSIAATFLASTIGVLMAYFMSVYKIRGKAGLEICIIISMLSPPFIGAYSWILLLGRNGFITNLMKDYLGIEFGGIYGMPGLLLVFTLQLFPLIYLYVSGVLKKMDRSLIEASESLGSSAAKRFFTIILPLILPTLLSGAMLVFMRAMADFGTPQLIGEGYRVMPNLIYNEFISELGGDDGFAAALSSIMIVVTTVLFLVQKYFAAKSAYSISAINPIQPRKLNRWPSFFMHLFVYVVVLLGILPQLTVTYTSFQKTSGRIFVPGYGLESYETAFTKLGSAIRNTYVYSIAAVAIIIVLGSFIAYLIVRRPKALTNFLDTLTMVPYIIPGSVIGIALLMAFKSRPLMLIGTPFIIIIAYVIRRLPYTIRSSAAMLSQIDKSVEEAAVSLGSTSMKAFRQVLIPTMLPGIISGALLSWMTIISELSASVVLYVGSTKTLTIAIYSEIIRSNYGVAAALSVILTLSTVVTLLLFFKLSGKREISI